ncbi:DUF1992 domain-containing protein [Pseudovibrio flavus]|uniref:DUF1992 domain-containing protein n=1 Tax=Pseudovibrio flavus TaxID=2529854 RepID=UPI00211CBDD9|nr:DUF1992 domain-containing protein [Pseudovibrio flavus]
MFDKLIERQINMAQSRGELKNLSGEGKAIPRRYGLGVKSATQAMGYSAASDAGSLKREEDLKKQIAEALRAFNAAEGDAKREAMQRLSDLQMQLSAEKDARANLANK